MAKLYHFTCLLEEELEDLLTNGLEPLSYTLIAKKLRILGQDNLAANIHNIEYDFNIRLDQTCFITSSFENLIDMEEVEPLITKWGGEALHDLNDIYDFGTAYNEACAKSKAYEISIDTERLGGIELYENFSDIPLREIKIDPNKEYQVKKKMPSNLLAIRELTGLS